MSTMSECPACHRHVRITDPQCPFCGSREERPPARKPRPRLPRLSRAAIFFAGAVGTCACGSTAAEPGDPSQGEPTEVEDDPNMGEDDPNMGEVYGAPPTEVVEENEPVPVPAYGAPAPSP